MSVSESRWIISVGQSWVLREDAQEGSGLSLNCPHQDLILVF